MGAGKSPPSKQSINNRKLDSRSLWKAESGSVTAWKDLDLVLGSLKGSLPIAYWRPFFFFFGTDDSRLHEATKGKFPAALIPGKSHPVFSLRQIRDTRAVVVCPCSSRPPFNVKQFRYIKKNTILLHTGYRMDRNSCLVETIRFNIPAAMATDLVFKGEVPEEALITEVIRKEKNAR